MRRARELEPFAPLTHALSAQVAYQARDFAAAVEHARRAIAVDSQLWIGYIELGQVYAQTGDNERALEAFADAGRLSSNNSKALSFTGHLLARMGQVGEAREVLRTLETISRERYVAPYAMAFVHAGVGERDAAFESLDKAYDERDVRLIFLPVDRTGMRSGPIRGFRRSSSVAGSRQDRDGALSTREEGSFADSGC
jgi:serine/threonine-protein kinase